MSEVASALAGAAYSGVIKVEDAGLKGMITLRGDLSNTDLQSAVSSVTGAAFPDAGEVQCTDESAVCWMSPDELLVLTAYEGRKSSLDALNDALKDIHYLAADVSDARAIFRLTGDDVAIRECLAKLTPADLRATSLPPGRMRRTRLAQVPAAFWFRDLGRAELICFRSVADYVFGLLKAASAKGSQVGYF